MLEWNVVVGRHFLFSIFIFYIFSYTFLSFVYCLVYSLLPLPRFSFSFTSPPLLSLSLHSLISRFFSIFNTCFFLDFPFSRFSIFIYLHSHFLFSSALSYHVKFLFLFFCRFYSLLLFSRATSNERKLKANESETKEKLKSKREIQDERLLNYH